MNGSGFIFDENTRAYTEELSKTGRLPHALIIESPDPQKGMDLAVYLSMFAVCSGNDRPCGECKNCRNARNKAHSDISFPQLPPKKKGYEVDQMRELIKDSYILPNEAEAKVYIFESADERFSDLVQNTFLKLSILSRFTVVRIRGDESIDEQSAKAASAIVRGIIESREYPLLLAMNALADKDNAGKVLSAFRLSLRDALALLSGGEPVGDRESAKLLAGRLTRKKLLEMTELCASAEYKIKQNVNTNLLTTWMCGELRRITWQR